MKKLADSTGISTVIRTMAALSSEFKTKNATKPQLLGHNTDVARGFVVKILDHSSAHLENVFQFRNLVLFFIFFTKVSFPSWSESYHMPDEARQREILATYFCLAIVINS